MGSFLKAKPNEIIPQKIPATREGIREFCRQHRIRRLALFGSVLRDDFTAQSDIGVIAEFEPGEPVELFRLGTVEAELSDPLGRRVDLNLQDWTPPFRSACFPRQGSCMTQHGDSVYLDHMLAHAREALAIVAERTREDLCESRVFQLALLHLVEIVGGAASKVSQAARCKSSTPR